MSELIFETARTLDIPGQAVIGTTLDGSIVYWSDSATKIYGWSRGEVLGRDILAVTPTDANREVAAQIMAELAVGRTWTGRFRLRDRYGKEIVAVVRDVPVRDESGTLVGIVGISSPVRKLR